ncbi:hypothetical protein IAR50_004977 [Cryptococcus sp. DSM 104548]
MPSHCDAVKGQTRGRATQSPRPNPKLPDLTCVASAAHTASILARPPPPTILGRPGTREFSFAPLPYTDADLPLPKPYNSNYPHPITAYASPGANPEAVMRSGYGEMLDKMVKEDIQLALGDILYEAGFRDLEHSVYLLFSYESAGQGNGIPESLWSKFENVNNVRLPTAAAVTASVASTAMQEHYQKPTLPPRFSQQSLSASSDEHLETPANNSFQPRSLHRECQPVPFQSRLGAREEMNAWKTEVCVAWETSGHCKYGPGCQFAHGIDDLKLTRRQLVLRGLVIPTSDPDPTPVPNPDVLAPALSSSRQSSHSPWHSRAHTPTGQPYAQPFSFSSNIDSSRRMSVPYTHSQLEFGGLTPQESALLASVGYRRQSEVVLEKSGGAGGIYPIGVERVHASQRGFWDGSYESSPGAASGRLASAGEDDFTFHLANHAPSSSSSDSHQYSLTTFQSQLPATKPGPPNLALDNNTNNTASSSSSSSYSGSRLSVYSSSGLSDHSPTGLGTKDYLFTPKMEASFEDVVFFGGSSTGGNGSFGSGNGLGLGLKEKTSTTFEFSSGKSIW